jgi:hypothetical protein
MMPLKLEEAIEHVGEVEDEVLQLLENHPEYVKSIYMLKAINHLKFALESLKCVRQTTATFTTPPRRAQGQVKAEWVAPPS